jgi:hypothetical protein
MAIADERPGEKPGGSAADNSGFDILQARVDVERERLGMRLSGVVQYIMRLGERD